MIRPDNPRRYIVDANGDRVLLGLTLTETSEFEALDSLPELEDADSLSGNGGSPVHRENRWVELYMKHDRAWQAWSASARGLRGAGPFPGLLRRV
jgi:hypothetical protein